MASLIGGVLLLFAVAGLALVLRWRYRSGGRRRGKARAGAAAVAGNQHGGAPMPGPSGARADRAGRPDPRNEGRAPSVNEPDWPYPDHPSWPAGSTGRALTPDHPSWPASNIGRPIGYRGRGGTVTDLSDDHPSWPGGPRRDLAGEPRRHDPHPQPPAPQVSPARGRHVRVPAGYSGHPRPGVPTGDLPQRGSARRARNPGPIPSADHDLAHSGARLQVMLAEARGEDPGWAPGPGTRARRMLRLPGPGPTGQPVSWDTRDYGSADAVRVAERVLADADQQAAAIRQEAASQAVAVRETADRQAAEIRQQAAAEAAPIRDAAEREAAEIRQQATAEVAGIRAAAEREAAELRTTVLAMADELRRVAEYITENLTSPGQPAAPPPRQAGPHPRAAPVQPSAEPTGPDAEVAAGPAGRPGSKPGAKRRGRLGTKSAGKPGTSAKGRQVRAMHKMVAAFAAVSVAGVIAGSAEIALHGFPFFVFRANGAGASLTGLKEDQGPGQPNAPGAHHKAPAATPGAAGKTRHPGAAGKAHHPGALPKGKRPRGKNSPGKKPQNGLRQGKPPSQQSPGAGKSG